VTQDWSRDEYDRECVWSSASEEEVRIEVYQRVCRDEVMPILSNNGLCHFPEILDAPGLHAKKATHGRCGRLKLKRQSKY
jgi:hypothetical protein